MLLHPHFDLCYSSTLISLGFDTVSVPCPRGDRYEGKSRMSPLNLFMHGVRMLMPFTDRIAVRALTAFSVLFGVGVACAGVVVGVRLFTNAAIPGWSTITLLGVLILSVVALGNFVVLFAVFSHSRGISLANLEELEGDPSWLSHWKSICSARSSIRSASSGTGYGGGLFGDTYQTTRTSK